MNNAIRVGLVLAAALMVPSGAFAASAKSTPAKTAPKICLVCPITGQKIASIKDAAGHSTYNGVTYYFCCAGCKPVFDKDPAKYVKALQATEAKHAKETAN